MPRSISPDGKRLVFDTGTEIWSAPIEGDAKHPHLGARTKFVDAATPIPEVQFSPDGRWVAYESAELDSSEMFVQPYPAPGRPMANLEWRRTLSDLVEHRRRALLHGSRSSDSSGRYTVDGHSFSSGTPRRVWSETRVADLGVNRAYDLAPDGKRFAAILNADQAGESTRRARVAVVVNFADELRQRLGKQ